MYRRGNFVLTFSRLLGPVACFVPCIAEIGLQHRKMAGLELEMYSMYEAAEQSLCKSLYFDVKGVVDLGTASKGQARHKPRILISEHEY